MAADRLFLTQDGLDAWLESGSVELEGEIVWHREADVRLLLQPALYFNAEVSGDGDDANWVGRVKTHADVAAAGADISVGAVMLGERAYDVVDGFMATLQASAAQVEATPTRIDAAAPVQLEWTEQDLSLLAKLLGAST